MDGQQRPFSYHEYAAEVPPEHIFRELAKLGLEGQRFSPMDYGEKLAVHVGVSIRVMPTKEKRVMQGLKQKAGVALAIHRLTGNIFDPEEAAILLYYARRAADLSYDPEENQFLVGVSEDLKPLSFEHIEHEANAALHRIRFRIGRPGHFWRKNYFLSSTLDLAIYRQLSHIACGHPVRLQDSSDRFWIPVERLTEKMSTHNDSPDATEEVFEHEADRRALWLLRIAKPRPSLGLN